MKDLLSLRGAGVLPDVGDERSALSDLPVIFPHGIPSRGVSSRAEGAAVGRRSVDGAAWGEAISKLLGGSVQTATYSPKEAYALSPYMAPAIHAFAGTVAARTFRVMEGKKALDQHWLIDLIARPNSTLRMSEYQLLYYTAALWRYDGEVFWQLEYGNDRKKRPDERHKIKAEPTAIWIWHKSAVTPKINEGSRDREFLGWEINFEGLTGFVDRHDMVHFPVFDPSKFNPLGPSPGTSLWQAKRLAMTNEIRANRWNADWWGRGLAPSVAFVNPSGTAVGSSDEDQNRFLDKVKAKLSGKNGEPLVLTGDWVISQLEATQRDAQFVEGRDQDRKAILAGNTPPIAMGDNEANYANANAQIKAWLSFDVIPALTFFASCIDVAFFYDEPNLWTQFSTDDIDELQEGMKERVDRYIALISARHSPKVAAQIAGIDVDPSMPGYDEVLVSYAQVPYSVVAEGQTVLVKDDQVPTPAPTAPVSTEPTPAPSEPKVAEQKPDESKPPVVKQDEPQRVIRLRVAEPAPIAPIIRVRAVDDYDELLRVILKIVQKDTKKVRDRARQFQIQAFDVGKEQVGKSLQLDSLIAIDNPRVVEFLETRGNLITSVPEGVAVRIFNKTVALIETGTAPEEIGTILRKDYNELTGWKSQQIARQEVGSGLNAGRHIQMTEEGVESRGWLSSRDDRVRDTAEASHVQMDGEVVEGVDTRYSNGLLYPQDPAGSNAEVQGCRCIEQAVIGGKRSAHFAAHMRAIAAAEVREAAKNGERIDERTGYWRAVVRAKDVRQIERRMTDAMSGIIHGWRAPILKALAEMGVAK